jgi:hypothetical protein
LPGYLIDRFEGPDWAVLEDEHARTFSLPREWLPDDVREGDLLDASRQLALGAHYVRFSLVEHGREARLEAAKRKRAAIPQGPKGDISL